MNILFVVLMAFAWAIGGEKHFGKWRRGALLSVPLFLFCYTHHLTSAHYMATVIYCYAAYQLLFYDSAIQMMVTPGFVAFGGVGLMINGAIIGALPVAFTGSITPALINAVSMLIFALLSNICKWRFPGDVRLGDVKIWCPADSWWLSELCIGAVLGISFLMK